ncbi:MAG TPA: nickel pincer cofactor biosynthesis protein LarC [Sedimentisphaerales bacterium]|nr:nickel pincer cofactor biosynthesis protein LarC [Sedimentisphaerales bacterium]
MKIAYFDCFAGAGGDMIVAAMLDAGLETGFLEKQLARLCVKGLEIKVSETRRAGLRAIAFEPVIPHEQEHRNLEQITRIIQESGISPKAKRTAIAIFDRLAGAEAAVHSKDPNDIHFHEVGALDSIVDIVSASVGLEALGVEKVYCSALSVGGGTVKCAHGLMPVPAPATAELIKGVPAIGGPIEAELLTPTAAAILTTVAEGFCDMPAMRIEAVGYGAGSLNPEQFPNVVRLILGQAATENAANTDTVCVLQTNIDDISGELIGFVTEGLLEHGALDVFTTPIFMKHNRPAVQLSVICKVEDAPLLEQMLFEQGLTFGIRKQILHRSRLARDSVTVGTEFGEIRVKVGSLNGRIVNAKPEFADCAAAAKKHGVPLKAVLEAAMAAYRKEAQDG